MGGSKDVWSERVSPDSESVLSHSAELGCHLETMDMELVSAAQEGVERIP